MKKDKRYRVELKQRVIKFYGAKCICCNISDINLLSIDHINGDGNKHRKDNNVCAGTNFYYWLENNNFPDGFRVLCYNCNNSLGHNGYCPHSHIECIDTSYKYALTDINHIICRSCGDTLSDNNWYAARQICGKRICKKCDCKNSRKYVKKLKMIVMNAYGDECKICKEKHLEFLVIDHINNNGKAERAEIGFGKIFYKYLIDNNFPSDNYQILCHNCNSYKEYIVRRGNNVI